MSAADTARRLQLPCPVCGQRGQLTASCYGKRVAVSCHGCGHVWAEAMDLHVILRKAASPSGRTSFPAARRKGVQ